jgi:RNase adaptor protein for sRNA GlmZ degradation
LFRDLEMNDSGGKVSASIGCNTGKHRGFRIFRRLAGKHLQCFRISRFAD